MKSILMHFRSQFNEQISQILIYEEKDSDLHLRAITKEAISIKYSQTRCLSLFQSGKPREK